ncbi:MAG: heme-binding domain-containing protein [Flavobacteriales bacterium]|nr:heme-binding domain-containing protein [Flavobacteriales bacterium]
MSTRRKILLFLLVAVVVIQFIPVDRSAAPVQINDDIRSVANVPAEVSVLLEQACYDCHSNETNYPWYSRIAPVSWMLQNHIKEGREEMNFSVWASYPEKKQRHKMDESYELVGEGEMPLKGYTLMHAHARLSDAQRKTLTDWFMSQAGKSGERMNEAHEEHSEHD